MEQSEYLQFVKESGRPVVMSLSGGKDSTATLIWLLENEVHRTNKIHYVFCDTGWEAPEVYTYLEEVINQRLCDGELKFLTSSKYPGGMAEMIREKGIFPNRWLRFCTSVLKTDPIAEFLESLGDDPLPINTVGIRAAESQSRSALLEWEEGQSFGKKSGPIICSTWRPLITAVVADVIELHTRANIPPNPLYLRDDLPAKRVGCNPCIFASKRDLKALAANYPERIDQIRQLEQDMGEVAQARREKDEKWTPEMMSEKEYPTFFRAKRKDGQNFWPIDKVIQWAKTSHGGKQYELFLPQSEEERGCAMWGLCDIEEVEKR